MHMSNYTTQKQKILDLAKELGVIQVRDIKKHGIHHEPMRRLCKEGKMVKVGRGLYKLADMVYSENHGLAIAAKQSSNGVVCLLSALSFHSIGTQVPSKVWIAYTREMRIPKLTYPKLHNVHFSEEAMKEGVEVHIIEGVPVKITNPARTVADCFKYRNKIGLDVAIEALRESLKDRRFTIDELWKYAKLCRVSNIIQPYLESMA